MSASAGGPTRIGKYAVLETVDEGPPQVYHAAAPTGPRGADVELATIERVERTPRGAAPVDLEALAARARRIAGISSFGLPRSRGVFATADHVVVVYDFLDGETAAELDTLSALADAPVFDLKLRLRLLLDALGAIASIHGLPAKPGTPALFHGHVTPASVVVGTDGAARVVRLNGLPPRPAGPNDILELEHAYSAPEILLGDATADARADVYSAGVMLWEALSGRRLFTEPMVKDMLARQTRGELPVAEVPASAPWAAALVPIASKALALEPEKRFPNAAPFASAVRNAVARHLAAKSDVANAVRAVAGASILARRTRLRELAAGVLKNAAPAAVPAAAPAAAPVRAPVPAAAARGVVDSAPTLEAPATVVASLVAAADRNEAAASSTASSTASVTATATAATPASTEAAPAPAPEEVPAPPVSEAEPFLPVAVVSSSLLVDASDGAEDAQPIEVSMSERPPIEAPLMTLPPGPAERLRLRLAMIVGGVLGVAALLIVVALMRRHAASTDAGAPAETANARATTAAPPALSAAATPEVTATATTTAAPPPTAATTTTAAPPTLTMPEPAATAERPAPPVAPTRAATAPAAARPPARRRTPPPPSFDPKGI